MNPKAPTYESIVAHTKHAYERRLAELKQAEWFIREVSRDIEAITAAELRLATDYGFDITDGKTPEEVRWRPALRLRLDVFQDRDECMVRLLDLLLERGWVVVYAKRRSSMDGVAFLSKPKIRARLSLLLPASWFDAQEATANTERQHVA